MSKKNFWVQSVMAKLSQESLDDAQEGIKTEEVTTSADAQIEIRRLKDAQETEVLISSLEHDLVEIEGLNDGVEELATAQEEIGELRAAMESFAEQGGMSKQTAQIASIALRQAAARVYMDVATPSLESFAGSTADRVDMTVLSVEEADGVLVKAWKAIVEFFKNLGIRISEWFKRLLMNIDKEKEKTKAALDEAEKAAAANKKVDLSEDGLTKLAKLALVGAKVKRAQGDQVTVGRDESVAFTSKFLDGFHKMSEKFISAAENIKGAADAAEFTKNMTEQMTDTTEFYTSNADNAKSVLKHVLVGGGAFAATAVDKEGKLSFADDSIVDVIEVTEKEIDAKDVVDVLKSADGIYDTIKGYSKRNEALLKRVDAFVSKKSADGATAEDRAFVESIQKIVKAMAAPLTSPVVLRLQTKYVSGIAALRSLAKYK